MPLQVTKFRFKGYEFLYNPRRFRVEEGKNLKTWLSPFGSGLIQDLGFLPRRITGEGELTGDLMGEYARLDGLFRQADSGLLYLPDANPFYCFFQKLAVVGQAGPRVLTYSFEFLEDCQRNSGTITAANPYYLAKAGDSLSLIAVKCGVSLSGLAAKNPALAGKADLPEGTLVWLPVENG